MRAWITAGVFAGVVAGCGESSSRPPALVCPDGEVCGNGGGVIIGGGGGTTPRPDGGSVMDAGPASFSVGGAVLVLDQIPPTGTAMRVGVSGWTVRASDDPDPMTTSGVDGTFVLANVRATVMDGGVNTIGVRAISPNRTTFGSYREVRAGAGSASLETYGSERVLEAVAAQGGAPSADLGHVIVQVTEATDPSRGVAGATVIAGSASTSFYDSTLIPGQLTPSVNGTGPRGFALVLNVPAGTEPSGGTVLITVQVPGATPVPATQTVRVYPNTISWTTVRVTR